MMSTKDPAHPELLKEIGAFLAERGMSKTAFGSAALNDPGFIASLEGGRECRRATIARVRAFMQTPAEAAE